MGTKKNRKPIEILMEEKKDGNIPIAIKTLRNSRTKYHLNTVSNGVEGLNFLYKAGKYANVPSPQLIMTDMNFIKKDWCEMLGNIKKDPLLRSIPVVIFIASTSREDIAKAYNLYPDAYIAKPTNIDKLIEDVIFVERFWENIVSLTGR